MKKPKARILYTENWNSKGQGIIIETDTGNGWEFNLFFPLVAKVGADTMNEENEKNFVHWRILRRINELIICGYKITSINI